MASNYLNDDLYREYFKSCPDNETEEIPVPTPMNMADRTYGEHDGHVMNIHMEDAVTEREYESVINRRAVDDNIDDLEQLADILKRLCNAAWGDDWGILSTDLQKGEDGSTVILPQITMDINTRDPAEGLGGPKPKLIDVQPERDDNGELTGDSFLIYRQWYDTNVEFNFYGHTNAEARKLQNKFEKLMMIYTGYLKRHGISEVMFEQEVSAKFSLHYNESSIMRCIFYYIRFESIMLVRQSTINAINIKIGANRLDAEKVKTLIDRNQVPVDLDFFEGDTGITFNNI